MLGPPYWKNGYWLKSFIPWMNFWVWPMPCKLCFIHVYFTLYFFCTLLLNVLCFCIPLICECLTSASGPGDHSFTSTLRQIKNYEIFMNLITHNASNTSKNYMRNLPSVQLGCLQSGVAQDYHEELGSDPGPGSLSVPLGHWGLFPTGTDEELTACDLEGAVMVGYLSPPIHCPETKP